MISIIENEYKKIGKIKLLMPYVIVTLISLSQLIIFKDIEINLSLYLFPYIQLMIIVIFSGIVSDDTNYILYKMYITTSKLRRKIYLSKLLTIIIFVFCLTTYILIIYSVICKSININFICKYYLYSIPIYLISSLILMLSVLIKNTQVNSILCVILVGFGEFISEFLFKYNLKFVKYTFLPYMDFSIFIDKVKLIKIDYNVNLNIYYGIFICILFIIIFNLVGCKKFIKKRY